MIDLFCIASGPSLTAADCELVRQSRIKTVAVNNSWEMANFCTFIYAGDSKWWTVYNDKITITAERWTCSDKAANTFKINYHIASGPYNSGMRAIQFGIWKGFKHIALLGYDCSVKNGIHWHEDHDSKKLKNPNTEKAERWKMHFEKVSETAKKINVEIVNCSRYTELECFKRMSLENAINGKKNVN